MSRFYIEPIKHKEKLPIGVALQVFVKTSGDTVAVVNIMEDGGYGLWRNGSCLGTFDNINAIYKRLDRVPEHQL